MIPQKKFNFIGGNSSLAHVFFFKFVTENEQFEPSIFNENIDKHIQ